jgi:ABC-2 type transport system ATP-binding protein
MMGFLRPDSGSIKIGGLDSWREAAEIKKQVGYVPGEIAFPDAPTGTVFLKRQAELLGVKDMSYANEIVEILQLDPTANLKRMSKGMKQKTAIVAAFMANTDILILDEPTTGLDPLMRAGFIELINTEKEKGKTIFMSSHMFEEMEDTCDKVALIRDGQIIAAKSTIEIKRNENKEYKIEFTSADDYRRFLRESVGFGDAKNASSISITGQRENQNQVFVGVNDRDINGFLSMLKNYNLKFITEIKYSLEQYFKSLYLNEAETSGRACSPICEASSNTSQILGNCESQDFLM